MLTSATPLSPLLRHAATPTMAQSWARRLNFWKLQPALAHLGHADLGQELVGRQGRLEEAVKKSAGGDLPLPFGPWAT